MRNVLEDVVSQVGVFLVIQEECSEVVELKPKKMTIANNIDELNTYGLQGNL